MTFRLAGLRAGNFARPLLAAAAIACATALLAAGPSHAATLPAGFSLKEMPTGLSAPYSLTDFSRLPDNSYFASGKDGQITWTSAAGVSNTVANLPVVTEQDLGLSGIAVARDYATTKTIYTARTLPVNGVWQMRLSAWTVTGGTTPTGLTNERIVLQQQATSNVHTMTTVLPAADGTLWVSIGDSADFVNPDKRALRAIDASSGYGKLLHITAAGNGVSDNPYYSASTPASWRSRVWAYGFRSPFRFSLDPNTGAPVLGDVGWNRWEEVDYVKKGANYGWPCWEGTEATVQYSAFTECKGVGNTAPITRYFHGAQGTSVTGGIVYTGTSYPAAYRGAYFFGDYTSARLYTMRYSNTGALTQAPEANGMATGIGGPVKFAPADNGDILFADITTNKIQRLVYGAGNRAPTAKASTSTNAATRTVSFDASASSDLDGNTLTYAWSFGDGASGTGVKTSHTYAGNGPYTAKLTVTDSIGASRAIDVVVSPGNGSPQLTLSKPADGTLFKVGDEVRLSATANDPEDGARPVTFRTTLIHCSGGTCHNHPGTSIEGGEFSTVFTDHGDNTTMEITASATDSQGVVSSETYVAKPKLRKLTVESNVPVDLAINGQPRMSADVTVGSSVALVPPAKAKDGVSTFAGWADGGPTERSVEIGDADQTLRLSYSTPIDQRYDSDAAVRAAVGAPTAAEQGDEKLRYRDYTNGRVYWTAASGVHYIAGALKDEYVAQGGHVKFGEPKTDETASTVGGGRFVKFNAPMGYAAVYWTQATGAKMVYGDIGALWDSMGAEKSVHGYPKSSELTTPNGKARYNDFQNGGIYWTAGGGAKSVLGAIYAKWAQFGWEAGILGLPTTNETATPDGRGRYNHFEFGSIYYTAATGAHEVHGDIKARWAALGWERSYLGYPTSDEFSITGGKRVNFEKGYITWNASNRVVTDRRY